LTGFDWRRCPAPVQVCRRTAVRGRRDRLETFMKRLLTLIGLCLILALVNAALANPDQWKRNGWGKTDFSQASVDFSEILSGGPPKDGIPSIDKPQFSAATGVDNIPGTEPVIRLEINGDLRAYPLRVMTWHEIVNDTVGGVPVAVTYCPLCNSAIVFERIVDGRETTFGTTGKLRNSDLVMYDRATESWWQQFTGEAIIGSQTGAALKMLPVRVVSFDEFRRESGEGKVLMPELASRPYGNNPYDGYDGRSAPYPFFTGKMPEGINPMARVIVVRDAGKVMAVSLAMVREKGSVSLDDIEISWSKGVNSALDTRQISKGRDVGAVRVRKGGDDMVHDITFAFAFHAFHPDIDIIAN
jgi:hypothetical protein